VALYEQLTLEDIMRSILILISALLALLCAVVAFYLLLLNVDLASKIEFWWNSLIAFIDPSEHAFGKVIVLLTFCLLFCGLAAFLNRRP
jgi:hypothetical protein